MPRSPNAAALTKVQTALGTEPLLIVEVDWTAATFSYADKDFLGSAGKILDLSGLDAIIKLGSSGSSGSLTVTLDDTDGTIKAILNTDDIHKRPVRVYQTYEGLVDGDKFLIFSGQVSSPIDWSEGDRTITFTIINEIEDNQLGFSPEESDADCVLAVAVGVPWPLAFGDVVRVPATKVTEACRGTSLTRYGQITIPELEQLCSLAVSLQQAETAKLIADGFPGFTDANYATVIDNLTGATISLNEFLGGLIFDSPTQEGDLRTYVDVCKEIERWRVFFQENLAKFQDAEQRLVPLESTPGKPAVTGFQFFGVKINPNPSQFAFIGAITTGFDFGQQEKAGYRVGVRIPKFAVTFREAVPAIVGAVEQAQLALAAFIDANWVYTTQEQWDQDLALNETLAELQAELNTALGDSTAASQFMSLANVNIAGLNTQKLRLENDLLQIVLTEIIVENGENFPQGGATEIVVNGMHFKGSFAGQVFTITQANTPADISVGISRAVNTNEFLLSDPTIQLKGKYCRIQGGITFIENQDGARCFINPILYKQTGVSDDGAGLSHPIFEQKNLSGTISETSVFLSKQWLDLTRNGDPVDVVTGLSQLRQRDYSIEIGDDVYLADDFQEVYVANLIPSLAIHEVMAYRVLDGVRKLLPIPSRYYTINLNEVIEGQNATTIRFSRPLTEFFGEAWEDKIFVSLTSSVGPNTVDIISHLVDTYTSLTKDAASFASVSAAIDLFPSSFAFLDRRGTLGAIEDIAWQARCAAFVKDDVIFLKYLAIEEAAIETVDESVADRQTFELTLTPTEDLITEFIAEWDSDYSAEKRNRVVLRNNIGKYGVIEEEFDFFIYNIQDLVIKSATFWIIRYSNTWKIAKFSTPLNMLRLETLDTIELDFGQDFIADQPVKGIVEGVSYDSSSFELSFEVQTSVRSGELQPYILTWPAGVDVDVEYPTPDDLFAGGATS